MKKLLLIVAMATALPTHANELKLYCTVTSVNDVAINGKLREISGIERGGYPHAEGATFEVDRRTGAMAGHYFVIPNSVWESHVIAIGAYEESFKMSLSGKQGVRQGGYMDVRLSADGDRKPFVLVEKKIFLGYCTERPTQK